jgi:hypothetical protein
MTFQLTTDYINISTISLYKNQEQCTVLQILSIATLLLLLCFKKTTEHICESHQSSPSEVEMGWGGGGGYK